MRRTPRRLWIALVLATLLLDLALSAFKIRDGAFGYRALPPFGAMHHPRQKQWLAEQQADLASDRRAGSMGSFDAELGWTNVAGSRTGLSVERPFSYNSIGARSTREYSPAPAPGVQRLACFGESFTHGDEVGDGDCWPALLESSEDRIEALNFGVGGHGTDQALLRMQREGLHGAQLAVLGFMLENIGRNVNRYRPLWHPRTPTCIAKPRFLIAPAGLELVPLPYRSRADLIAAVAEGSVIADLHEHEYWSAECEPRWLRFSSLARLGWGWWAYRRREVPRLYRDLEAEPAALSLALLEAFGPRARALGAERSLVLLFPRREELEAPIQGTQFWAPFVAELERRGVALLDLTPALLAARDLHGSPALLSGSHYSRLGNQAVADALRNWLASDGR
jgi:hypothetical protein